MKVAFEHVDRMTLGKFGELRHSVSDTNGIQYLQRKRGLA